MSSKEQAQKNKKNLYTYIHIYIIYLCLFLVTIFSTLTIFGKGQLSFQYQKNNAKEYSNYCTIALISHASKILLKILQAMWRIQQHVKWETPDV